MKSGLARLALVSALLASSAPALGQSYRLGDVTADENAGKATIPVTITGTRTAKSFVTLYVGAPGDTGVPGVDYSPIAKAFEVLPTDTKISLDVIFTNDDKPGPTKRITSKLVINSGGKLTDGTGVITRTDSDVIAPPQPILCDDGSSVIPPATCPLPPPVPGDVFVTSLDGTPPIPSEFPVDNGLKTIPTPPGSAAPDVVGAFRFTCGFAGLGRFDPIVYPGDRTGKSHLHQFYGNTGISPDSTETSLRKTGKSTCAYGDFPVNRSGYWQAALLDGMGNALQPDWGTIYYKRRPTSDPACTDPANAKYQGKCVPLPRGLRFIFGYDMVSGQAPTGAFDYVLSENDGNGTVFGPYHTFAEAKASGKFVPGNAFMVRIHSPTCWDGKRADSANHRDHVSYANVRNPNTGQFSCDAAHPFVMPEFSLLSKWSIVQGDDGGNWRWSSDEVMGLPGGTTFHADFFMAHDPSFRDIWSANPDGCIEALLNCSGGVASKTKQIVNANVPMYPDATGKLVGNWHNPNRVVPLATITDYSKLYGFSY